MRKKLLPTRAKKALPARLVTACGCSKEVSLHAWTPKVCVPIARPLAFNAEVGFDSLSFDQRVFTASHIEKVGRKTPIMVYHEELPSTIIHNPLGGNYV